MNRDPLKGYVSQEALAEYLSVQPSTIRSWRLQGKLPRHTYIRMGNTFRYSIPKVVFALSGGETVEEDFVDDNPDQLELDLYDPDDEAQNEQ